MTLINVNIKDIFSLCSLGLVFSIYCTAPKCLDPTIEGFRYFFHDLPWVTFYK